MRVGRMDLEKTLRYDPRFMAAVIANPSLIDPANFPQTMYEHIFRGEEPCGMKVSRRAFRQKVTVLAIIVVIAIIAILKCFAGLRSGLCALSSGLCVWFIALCSIDLQLQQWIGTMINGLPSSCHHLHCHELNLHQANSINLFQIVFSSKYDWAFPPWLETEIDDVQAKTEV